LNSADINNPSRSLPPTQIKKITCNVLMIGRLSTAGVARSRFKWPTSKTPAVLSRPIIKTLQVLKTLRGFDWAGAAIPQLSAQQNSNS
jgi:hypothetical protein